MPRQLTPARIAALALIALVACALGYLRLAPSDSITVPAGAEAGDLTLESCTYATEDGAYDADCGTLVVPENRNDPQSRLLALPVTRIKTRSDRPAEPLFRLQGGPGVTNMQFEPASRFAGDRDVVLVGYRGVDGSSRLDCPEVVSALKHSTDLNAGKSHRAYGDAFRACADRLQDDGVDLDGYTISQRVDDLEAARVALGYGRIDLVSESAGTRYAMVYAWRYPASIHRNVMIAVNPPGHFVWDERTFDEQIARYSALCKKDVDCSRRTDDLAAAMHETDVPRRWGFLPIKKGNVHLATLFGLFESTPEAAPLSAPMTLNAWLSAAEGDASGLWFQSVLADIAFPASFVWGELASMSRVDERVAQRHFASGDEHAGASFIWGGGELIDAWPSAPEDGEYARVRISDVETLLIGGELDVATPPQVATKELLPYLRNGDEVVLPGFAHSTTFWTEQPEAGTHLINTYLATGEVDDSRYTPQTVDFTPEVSQTALAKGIAGTMVGLALLTVLSLVWMAVRVRRRGGYGRKASAALRSVYPVVLGLGGWLLGVLVVLTTMPAVALDDELLSMLSVGLPVGLGIFLAWVGGGSSADSTGVGLGAAVAGALVGAWFGSHATSDLQALLTAIAGAIAGANLTLIGLDVSRGWAGDAPAAAEVRQGLERAETA